jgi:4-nitrophenyl phosphatase/NagD protein
MKNIDKIKTASCFLFDMDGTIYLGDKLMPGANAMIGFLLARGTPYYFLTNNSSRSRADYVKKLEHLGLPTPAEKIITSGEATAIFLSKQLPGASLYLVGTPSLEQEFLRYGFELVQDDPDYLVLGFDTTLTYEKVRRLCDLVIEGRPYIATHPDVNCPTESGFMPDIGAIIAMVEASTRRRPDVIVGKPHKPIIEAIVEKTGFSEEELVMVGDRLYTDIALGQAGIATVLVLSGESKIEDVGASPFQPDLIVQDVGELLSLLQA